MNPMAIYLDSLPLFVQITLGFAYAGMMVLVAGGIVWLVMRKAGK